MLDMAARAVLAAFDRLTGLHLLGDVQAFVAASTACTRVSPIARRRRRR